LEEEEEVMPPPPPLPALPEVLSLKTSFFQNLNTLTSFFKNLNTKHHFFLYQTPLLSLKT